MKRQQLLKRAFTLVELIIVIAIIAILAVTAFLLLTKWLSKARDSSRASNLANIEKSLQISLTDKSSLPKPDSYTLIYASGTSNIIGYQGFFGDGVKDAVGNINSAPKDGDEFFTYYLNADLNKYQLAGFLENTTAYNSNMVNAVDYSGRFVTVKGDRLGLLTDANKSPLQTLGLTGLDLLTGNTSYTAYLDNSNNVVGTGKQLFTYYYNQTKSLLQNKDFAKNDSSLVFYSDMETLTGTLLADLSQYGNNGICYNSGTAGNCGTAGPQFVQGKRGKAMQFNGVSGFIDLGNRSQIVNIFSSGGTISILFYANGYGEANLGRLLDQGFVTSGRRLLEMHPTYGFAFLQNYSIKEGCWLFGNDSILNKWHNISIVYSNQSVLNDPKIYFDGVFIGNFETRTPEGTLSVSTNHLSIGNVSNESRTFNGLIDEVRIYNRALSDDEVKALYTATN